MSNSSAVPLETTHLVRDTCLCLHTQRAARALSRRFDDALKPVGITSGQFSLLNALNRPQPPAIGPVAQLLAMDRTTLTAALKPLERDGLVAIVRDPKDGRNRLLQLTEKGREVLASAVPIWQEVHAAIEAGLPDLKSDDLRTALRSLERAT
jgi:DNA-binding MarR family transcriptional regulator